MKNIFLHFILSVKSFGRAQTGQISLMTALLFVVLAAFIGGAVDFTQKVSYTNKLQATLDNVSIAVAKRIAQNANVTDAELLTVATSLYNVNHQTKGNVTDLPFVVNRTTETLTVSQASTLQTSFMKLVGTPELAIRVTSVINIKRSDVELVLALDTTGSMNGAKLASLKVASTELINTLLDGSQGLESMRIGLVPWSVGVNVKGHKHKKVIAGNNKGKIKCAAARKGNYNDVSPITSPMPVAEYKYINNSYYNYIGCPNAKIFPLTDKKNKLLNAVGSWSANYHTSSDTAISWGWGMLSPEWNNLWKNKNQPKAYNAGVKKYLVLMTDGDNTMQHFDADEESRQLCAAAKDKGIKIYSIAFQAGSNAQALLQECASSPDMYIDASSGAALQAAFQRIADEVGSFYISG